MNWESAVEWYRQQPGNEEAVRANYFDRDARAAAERFAGSEEFAETWQLVPSGARDVLDLGAGAGIASFAFAKKGCRVTAVEPDPSEHVGAGAIRKLAETPGVDITVKEGFGEELGLPSEGFDLVYARQVLHHARDLSEFCREAARVLRSGGTFIATREHVLRDRRDLPKFLESHPLHRHYGGENACTRDEYLAAIRGAGLEVLRVIHPYESAINYHPMTDAQVERRGFSLWMRRAGWRRFDRLAWTMGGPVLRRVFGRSIRQALEHDYYPGILYSFVARKP